MNQTQTPTRITAYDAAMQLATEKRIMIEIWQDPAARTDAYYCMTRLLVHNHDGLIDVTVAQYSAAGGMHAYSSFDNATDADALAWLNRQGFAVTKSSDWLIFRTFDLARLKSYASV